MCPEFCHSTTSASCRAWGRAGNGGQRAVRGGSLHFGKEPARVDVPRDREPYSMSTIIPALVTRTQANASSQR